MIILLIEIFGIFMHISIQTIDKKHRFSHLIKSNTSHPSAALYRQHFTIVEHKYNQIIISSNDCI